MYTTIPICTSNSQKMLALMVQAKKLEWHFGIFLLIIKKKSSGIQLDSA